MTVSRRQEVLLEDGSNEMEIIEFYLGGQSFGINVQKLKEIIPFDRAGVTSFPDSDPAMLGTLLLRGNTLPLIDLKLHLGMAEPDLASDIRQVVLVCDFNNRLNGFKVDGVNQIHRVSWDRLMPMAGFIGQYRPRFTGSIHIEGREILIVDLEHIIAEFDPEADIEYEAEQHREAMREQVPESRARMKLMLAEDSALIRAAISKVLKNSGYSQLEVFDNGFECLQKIQQLKEKAAGGGIGSHLNLVISDIEMPKMDGLTLCRKIKSDPQLGSVKVVLFSSLINEQLANRYESVGADGYVTKPQIPDLVQLMDRFLGLAGTPA